MHENYTDAKFSTLKDNTLQVVIEHDLPGTEVSTKVR